MTLKASFTTIRYHTAADPYHYTVDNRPLTDLKTCLDFIADTIDAGFTTATLVVSGSITSNNSAILSKGSSGGLIWARRDTNVIAWQWYSSAGNAHLYDNVAATDKLVISQGTGNALFSGNVLTPVISAPPASELEITSQGANAVRVFTNNLAQEQFRISHTASAVNLVQTSGGATGSSTSIGSIGTDTDIGFDLYTKGTGAFRFLTNAGNNAQLSVIHTAGANRNVTITGSNGGNPTIGVSAGGLQLAAAVGVNSNLTIASTVSVPAGGTAGSGLSMFNTVNFGVYGGSGVPTLSAAKGSLYLRSDGTTTNNRAYINTDGGTTWTALTTAA